MGRKKIKEEGKFLFNYSPFLKRNTSPNHSQPFRACFHQGCAGREPSASKHYFHIKLSAALVDRGGSSEFSGLKVI